jgi:serine protease AprX
VASYAWTFGGDGSATGAQPGHTFSAAGTYEVTLQVTDDGGATGSTTQQVTVSAPQSGRVSIAGLSPSSSVRKGGWTATVAISVRDGSAAPVSGATVTGTWSTGVGTSCTTGTGGTCSVSLNLGRKVTSVAWTVAGISHATLTYDPVSNTVSSITVSSP